jgi:RNA polymerase sigma-70 factor (ECF subfamily)
MNDSVIIDLYFNRDEQAISMTKTKYEAYCMTVSSRILESRQDCEECVSDTWLHTWNAIPPHRPENLRLFLGKITRNLSFNCYKKNRTKKRGGGSFDIVLDELEECISDGSHVDDKMDYKELVSEINNFLGALPARDRTIFVRRYWAAEDVRTIAKQHGLSAANTKMILSRTRKKLKEHLEKEGYAI